MVSSGQAKVGSAEPPTADRRSRVDPRVAHTRNLVLEATYDLVCEVGFAGATVERIAERSGVARSSIYRHWPRPLPALHMESLAPLRERPEDIPPSGDLEQDLAAYLQHVIDRLNDPGYARASLALLAVAARDEAYARAHRELLSGRTEVLQRILQDAVDAGALCRCTDLALEARLLFAPLTHVRFVEHRRVDAALGRQLITRLTRNRPRGPHCTCADPTRRSGRPR